MRMSMGPGNNDQCCGKPVGCEATHTGCSYLNHKWKLENVAGLRESQMKRKHQLEHDAVVTAIKRYLPPGTPVIAQQFMGQLVGYVIPGVGYIGVREHGVEERLRRIFDTSLGARGRHG